MNTGFIKFVMICLAVLIIASLYITPKIIRNGLVSLGEEAEAQWKQIEVQLVRQSELIPKLVTVTRKYAEYESGLIQDMMDARNYFQEEKADNPEAAGARLEGAISEFLVVAEKYPQLKADRQYRALMYEVAGTKNRIATERMRYNESVRLLNTRLKQFPWSAVSSEFLPREYFMAQDKQLADPEIKL